MEMVSLLMLQAVLNKLSKRTIIHIVKIKNKKTRTIPSLKNR